MLGESTYNETNLLSLCDRIMAAGVVACTCSRIFSKLSEMSIIMYIRSMESWMRVLFIFMELAWHSTTKQIKRTYMNLDLTAYSAATETRPSLNRFSR